MATLVLNAGSSSLKLRLFDSGLEKTLLRATVEVAQAKETARVKFSTAGQETETEIPWADYQTGTSELLKRPELQAASIRAVGHRVVHGGSKFRESSLISDTTVDGIAECAHLAPLHNPPALGSIAAARQAFPRAPHVAVFDTAFFSDLPAEAYIYPLPYEWHVKWGIRRFGFHGISHAFCCMRARELAPQSRRLIICHLGSGCSASAILNGKPVAHTMGFTPLEGLMMATRAGSIDPGILLHVQLQNKITAQELEKILHHQSGLLGVSGVSGDYREVERAANAGNVRARLALDIYAARIRASIGALAASTNGIDALIFTAGVGENRPDLRRQVCAGMEFLGIRLDSRKNDGCNGESDLAVENSDVRILVIHTNEELMIARETNRIAKC